MSANISLRFAMELDRDYLFEIYNYIQFVLPFFNTFTLHPLMLLLLFYSNVMSKEIRMGYFMNEVFLIVFDWMFNFALSMNAIVPYSGFSCGGPMCRIIENNSSLIAGLVSTSIVLHIPCYVFVVMHMHNATSKGLTNTLKLNNRRIAAVMAVVIAALAADVFGFAYFGRNSDDAVTIKNEPELRWLVNRTGNVLVFGPFGEAQHFKYELIILGFSIFIVAPVPIFITIDAVKNLRITKSHSAASHKTHEITSKMLNLFILQLNNAMLCVVVPLFMLFIPMMVDIHELPTGVHLFLRIAARTLLTITPFQSPLVFILKSTGQRKLLTRFFQKFRPRKAEPTSSTVRRMSHRPSR